MNIRKVVTAATGVVGYDVLVGDVNARMPFARVIDGIGIVGSTAAGDCIAELLVGNKSEGMYANTYTGTAVTKDRDLIPLDVFVPANALVQLIIRDAINTNDAVFQIEFGKPQSKGRKRSYGRTRSSWAPRTSSAFRPATRGMY